MAEYQIMKPQNRDRTMPTAREDHQNCASVPKQNEQERTVLLEKIGRLLARHWLQRNRDRAAIHNQQDNRLAGP